MGLKKENEEKAAGSHVLIVEFDGLLKKHSHLK